MLEVLSELLHHCHCTGKWNKAGLFTYFMSLIWAIKFRFPDWPKRGCICLCSQHKWRKVNILMYPITSMKLFGLPPLKAQTQGLAWHCLCDGTRTRHMHQTRTSFPPCTFFSSNSYYPSESWTVKPPSPSQGTEQQYLLLGLAGSIKLKGMYPI